MSDTISTTLSFLAWAFVLAAVGYGVILLRRKGGKIEPNFMVAILVLGVAAVGLNGATQFLKLHFKKQAVEIAIPLKEIPSRLGPWVQISKDEPLESDIEAALATKEYIFRLYVDERVVGAQPIADLANLSGKDRIRAVTAIVRGNPQAVVNLAVTYYTGLVDTVAHIPDRCYIADGYVPSEYEPATWHTGMKPTGDTQVRFINFEDQSGEGMQVPRSVAYFFRVNDEYTSDPLGVRNRLQNLFEKYGFYSKVELMMTTRDHAKAALVMTDFLKSAMPEVEKCFPDWTKVNARDVK